MIELFECIPMNARISHKQCEYNRRQRDDHAGGKMADARCKACPGLGKSIKIELEEQSMANICKVDGCTKHVQRSGKCKAHLNGSEPRASVFKNAPKGINAAEVLPEYQVKEVDVVLPELDEITNIDYLAYMRQQFDQKFEEFATDLNSARTPYERAKFYLSQCDAIIGLGY